MRYPMTNNWLSYRRISRDEYSVHDNLDGSVYTMGYRVARFAKCLNGKRDPYGIDLTLSTREVKSMLLDLSEHDLLRTNRVLTSSFGTFLYTLWIPRWTKFLRLVACLMNCVLLLLWFPILLIGCYVFAKNLLLIDVDFSVGGHIVGLSAGKEAQTGADQTHQTHIQKGGCVAANGKIVGGDLTGLGDDHSQTAQHIASIGHAESCHQECCGQKCKHQLQKAAFR